MSRASSADVGDGIDALPVRVLIVEDEPVTAEAHAAYIERMDGVVVAGVAHDGRQTLAALRDDAQRVDLVLLDMNLPDSHGLQLVRALRATGSTVDVIAITAVRDIAVVRASVSLGIVQYLIKPFTFASFAERIEKYLAFRASMLDAPGQLTQSDVDGGLASLHRVSSRQALPSAKGISPATLDLIVAELRASTVEPGRAPSAAEVADRTDVSRVTARRYLEYLADEGLVEREARYGSPGRPEVGYRWR
ncbi:response regulator [Frigoribacterium sp. 2-23]|uniref:response regulator n=1 Tax=Frigoribacterium sp. 2-23 TaxID=3415006 RepID=UPI003C704B9D